MVNLNWLWKRHFILVLYFCVNPDFKTTIDIRTLCCNSNDISPLEGGIKATLAFLAHLFAQNRSGFMNVLIF